MRPNIRFQPSGTEAGAVGKYGAIKTEKGPTQLQINPESSRRPIEKYRNIYGNGSH